MKNSMILIVFILSLVCLPAAAQERVEEWRDKTVTKHVSQFEPSINKYRPDWDPREKAKLKEYLKGRATKKDGRYVEAFRRATGFNQQ